MLLLGVREVHERTAGRLERLEQREELASERWCETGADVARCYQLPAFIDTHDQGFDAITIRDESTDDVCLFAYLRLLLCFKLRAARRQSSWEGPQNKEGGHEYPMDADRA